MVLALILVMVAGGMNGTFAVPMKFSREWQWEHMWLVWSFFGMLLIPLIVALQCGANLWHVYDASGFYPLVFTLIGGMIWGVGTILFGLAIEKVGLALSFGIVLGTSSSIGTMVPFIIFHSDRLFSRTGLFTLGGISVIACGVVACICAGLSRDGDIRSSNTNRSSKVGLAICVLSGIGSSFMSIALNQSSPITRAAERLGVSPTISINTVWPILLGGGLIINGTYCTLLVIRRQRTSVFAHQPLLHLGLAAAMAVLFSGSNYLYSAGAYRMGKLGLVLGWPIFMASIVLSANGWGLLTGEWRGARRFSIVWASGGCILLVLGIGLIAMAGKA
jgi:L-rhamnose-H+ transport protein